MAIYGYARISADAGDDVTVRVGERVALDGTGSRSPRAGATLTYCLDADRRTGGDAGRRDLGDPGVHRAVGEQFGPT